MEIKRLIVGMVQTNCYIAVHPETKEAVIVDPGDEAARIEDALAQTGRFTEENFSEGGRYGCKAGRNPSDSWTF